ncbi:MAG: YraN family protein [Acidobacteriales bacterium]|nr:YraN family protein [Terriglobales bacterium]
MSGRLTHALIRTLDRAAVFLGRVDARPGRHITGARGEEEAYFFLRRLGYMMVARNYRSARRKGEIDLIGYDGDTLCFIEVKTRAADALISAEAAVDFEKQRDLSRVAREYLHRVRPATKFRFDVVTVYNDAGADTPRLALLKDAFTIK